MSRVVMDKGETQFNEDQVGNMIMSPMLRRSPDRK